MPAQIRNDEMVNLLTADFLRNNSPAVMPGLLDGIYMSLPGLRGFWPGSVVGAAGELADRSGNGFHLSKPGSPVFGVDGMFPYVEYVGGGSYHSHTDDAHFDITGTEAYIDNPGLTIGAWVLFDNAASGNEYVISKMGSGTTNLAYGLRRDATGAMVIEVYQSAAAATPVSTVSSDALIGASAWTLVIGRWVPSAEVMVMVNGVQKPNVSSIIAAIADGSALFIVGGRFGGSVMDGRVSRAFLCASAVPDHFLFALYQYGRHLYGV